MKGMKEQDMEDNVDDLSQQVDQYNATPDQFILPGTLMDCFEVHRIEEMRRAATRFTDAELTWFLQMMNELRGVADSKEDFDLLFDPTMYMFHDIAWDQPPGKTIVLPKLNSRILSTVPLTSSFAKIAKDEVDALRTLALTYRMKRSWGSRRWPRPPMWIRQPTL